MELKRVVVTGLGTVNPLGNDVQSTWNAMVEGKSGIAPITQFDCSSCKTHFAGEVKDFSADTLMEKKELRKLDRYSQFAIFAAKQALDDSAIRLDSEDHDRIGVIWGSGMGGMKTLEDELMLFGKTGGTPRFNPFYIPKSILNMAAGHISILFDLRGPNFATASACASSSHAIAQAFDYIRLGKANIILSGGSDADVTWSGIGGFNSMHAISTRNDTPETASRPFSKSRDGFVLSEGAACLVLEEYEHALRRGATIYAELLGVGVNADAHHMTAPEPEGMGASKAMALALEDAHVNASQVDYINTHGTSTPLGDIAEVKAIQRVFGDYAYQMNISSTKSMTGHLMGAAGAIEALATVMAIHEQIVPPTINHAPDDEDENIDYRLNFTFNKAQQRAIRFAISNTFGFGGHNASLLFGKV